MAEFNRDLASTYLTKLFGSHEGTAVFGTKGKNDSWQEVSFAWPAGRTDALAWIKRTTPTGNVFVNPALRADTSGARIKGDGIHLRWLWADVDWDKVPVTRREIVAERIEQLGSYVVQSGSGDNVHVYVRLSNIVKADQFHRLNTGLRDYLFADNKQADNSFLRVPGTVNWKTPLGAPVGVARGSGQPVKVTDLLSIETFKRVDAKLSDESLGVDWTPIQVNRRRISPRTRMILRMDGDEATARFGSRHKAVWALVGDLHAEGFTPDEIHTLLNDYQPAVEKRDEEHGAYDVHKDVERRLSKDRNAEDEILDEDDELPYEMLSDEDGRALSVQEMSEKMLLRDEARSLADRIKAERGYTAPPPDTSWTLSDALTTPPQPTPYIIDGLAGAKHNVVITAQYKTGKTAFVLGTLAQALCDGTEFLGEFKVNGPHQGTMVGHWNCEMDPTELLDDYLRPVGYANPDNLRVWNLRGYSVNLLTPLGREEAVKWLMGKIPKPDGTFPPPVKVWTIDSLARLARMAGIAEKDNDEMLSLLMAIDEIKVEADVDVCFVITHTGRMVHEEGNERARGATVIDDWPDARWIITKQGEVRFLAIEGRGVRMESSSLVYDSNTGRSRLGGGNKAEIMAEGGVQCAFRAVKEQPGINKTALTRVVKDTMKCGVRQAEEYIEDAIEAGFIDKPRRGASSGAKGGRPSLMYYPFEVASGGATPRVVRVRRNS